MVAITGIVHLTKVIFPAPPRAESRSIPTRRPPHDGSPDRPRSDDGAGAAAHPDRHRHGRGRLPRRRLSARLELRAGLGDGGDQGLRDGAQLYALGGAAVHPHGQSGHAGRHVAGAVPRRLHLHRPSARRTRHGDGVCLRRLRRHLRLLDRDRRHHGQGRLSGHEPARLLGPPVDRRDRRRRHARHSHSALDHHGDLRRA